MNNHHFFLFFLVLFLFSLFEKMSIVNTQPQHREKPGQVLPTLNIDDDQLLAPGATFTSTTVSTGNFKTMNLLVVSDQNLTIVPYWGLEGGEISSYSPDPTLQYEYDAARFPEGLFFQFPVVGKNFYYTITNDSPSTLTTLFARGYVSNYQSVKLQHQQYLVNLNSGSGGAGTSTFEPPINPSSYATCYNVNYSLALPTGVSWTPFIPPLTIIQASPDLSWDSPGVLRYTGSDLKKFLFKCFVTEIPTDAQYRLLVNGVPVAPGVIINDAYVSGSKKVFPFIKAIVEMETNDVLTMEASLQSGIGAKSINPGILSLYFIETAV